MSEHAPGQFGDFTAIAGSAACSAPPALLAGFTTYEPFVLPAGYAQRIVATKRQINMLAGWTPDEDTLPERFLDAPLPNDPAATLTRERLQELVAEYHRQRGW